MTNQRIVVVLLILALPLIVAFGVDGKAPWYYYPGAALFAFCVSLLAYNVLSVVKAALRSVHGENKVRDEVSGFYLAEEVSGVWRGMSIAIPADA